MRTIEIKQYEFSELTEQAKTKAVEDLWDINVNHDWYDFVYYDAKEIGCEISGFDLGRAQSIEFELLSDQNEVAHEILTTHGETTNTHKLAAKFKEEFVVVTDENLEQLEEKFTKDLAYEYWLILRDNYEYYTSEESIIETIECNEYWFTEGGVPC